jgi:hypothetical protein
MLERAHLVRVIRIGVMRELLSGGPINDIVPSTGEMLVEGKNGEKKCGDGNGECARDGDDEVVEAGFALYGRGASAVCHGGNFTDAARVS